MSAFYDRMQNLATRLVVKFDQEGAQSVVQLVVPNADPLLPPVVSEEQSPIPAVARGVSANIVASDPNLSSSDIQVIMDQRGGAISVGDTMLLDGVHKSVQRIDRIPAIGTLCAVRAYVR